jgi:hypothetical protein
MVLWGKYGENAQMYAIHVLTTYNYDQNVTTSEYNDPKTFRPRDTWSQKRTDCQSNQNFDTATPKDRS